jgi:hypothetical protein
MNMRLSSILLTSVFCIAGLSLYAQDTGENEIETFLEEHTIVSCKIVTKIVSNTEEILWSVESKRVTISGKSIDVVLEGDDITIEATFTPYLQEDGSIFLIAIGEVFIGKLGQQGVEYASSFRSLPVEKGERFLFFPLGLALDENTNMYSIEMELTMLPYTELLGETE